MTWWKRNPYIPFYAGVMTDVEVTELAEYNTRRREGISHTPEFVVRMAELQQRFDDARHARHTVCGATPNDPCWGIDR